MAIESARNGLQIYQSDNHTKNVQNIYGIALQSFQIGYLLKSYAKDLCSDAAIYHEQNQDKLIKEAEYESLAIQHLQ